MPVEAIPIDSTRAPVAKLSSCGCSGGGGPACGGAATTSVIVGADEQHRPGERRANLEHRAVATEQADERPLGEVVDVARGVAELADIGAAGDVQRAPQRLARNRHQEVAA